MGARKKIKETDYNYFHVQCQDIQTIPKSSFIVMAYKYFEASQVSVLFLKQVH